MPQLLTRCGIPYVKYGMTRFLGKKASKTGLKEDYVPLLGYILISNFEENKINSFIKSGTEIIIGLSSNGCS